jgi:pantoate kinase
MDEAEMSAFEQDVAVDAEIQEQLQFTQEVASATRSREEKLAKMQEWEDDYEWKDERNVAAARYRPTGSGYESCPAPSMEQTPAMPRSFARQYLYWISGIAAIFIVGFFLIHNFMGSEDNVMFDPSSIEYRVMRGGENYANIEKLLVDKKYEVALKQIEIEEAEIAEQRTATDSISDVERRAYDQMLIQEKTDELSWMKVYALLGVDRRDDALRLLDQLRQSEGEYKSKADSLYLLINK